MGKVSRVGIMLHLNKMTHVKFILCQKPRFLPQTKQNDINDDLISFSADPTEHFDIADQHPDIVEDMKKKLEQYKASEVPPNYPPPDPKSNPDNFGGNWSPGWC